jgi:RHS repeat-associated protein
VATFGWDGMKRQTSQTLPSGQVINHEYGLGQGPGASWHKVTTGISPNFRWTKTLFDGFGRTLEVISGHKVGAAETAVSKVLTAYTPCACSTIGKVNRTSMPFAANASPAHWTTYDFLKRLTSATQTAGPVAQPANLQWGLSFTYDGFGNRWNQTIQGGKAGVPSALTFDEARNRITGQFWQYDANGNTTGMPQTGDLSYDVDNRLLTITREGSAEAYGYLADNKRFWKSAGGVESYYLYGLGGQRILTYSAALSGGVLTLGGSPKMDVVFAGRVIRTNGVAVVMDRLGSVVTRSTGAGTVANHRYYPYGEEIEGTVGDRTKFGTYHRDQTGVDYADQRYYCSHLGRYLTQDPCRKADDVTNPITLNRFLYVLGDPVNRYDPSGLISGPSVEQAPECNSGGGGDGGGGAPVDEVTSATGFIGPEEWKKDPARATRLWDALIAQAVKEAFENDDYRPVYLQVEEECVYTSPTSGSLALARRYVMKDRHGLRQPGGRFIEQNAVVAGESSAINATFRGDDWDFILAGNQPLFSQYQTFMGITASGSAVPLYVRELDGTRYGVLATEATRTSIKVNGIEKAGIKRCGPNVPIKL